MAGDNSLTTTDKLLYLGRLAWSQARLPVALLRLSIAAEHLRERAFPRGALLAREGEAHDQLLRAGARTRAPVAPRRRARRGGARVIGGTRAPARAGPPGHRRRRRDGRPRATARLRHAARHPRRPLSAGARRHPCRHTAAARPHPAAARAARRRDRAPVPSAFGPADEPRRGAPVPAHPGRAVRTVEHRRARGAGGRVHALPVRARTRLLEGGRPRLLASGSSSRATSRARRPARAERAPGAWARADRSGCWKRPPASHAGSTRSRRPVGSCSSRTSRASPICTRTTSTSRSTTSRG